MAHQQPRLRPSEENHVGATRRTNQGAQIGAQTDLRLTCGAQQYHAAPVSGFSEPIIPNSTMSPPYFALERAAQVEGDFSAAGSPSYLDFNEGKPTPIDHPPSSSDDPRRHHAENHHRHHHHHQPPYDPRFFDVGTSFLPTTLPQPRAGPSDFPDALVPWQNPSHNHLPFQSGSTHVSMMTSEPPLDLAPMPPAPGMSSFEPMITTLEGHLGARTPRAPGMAPTTQSPVTPNSSSPGNNNSNNYLSTNTGRLDIRFEQVSEPQAGARTTTARKKSSTKNSSRDRPAPTKRMKPEAGATRKRPTTKNVNSLNNNIEDDNNYYYYYNDDNNAINASTAPGDESSPEEPGRYLNSPESPHAQDSYGDLNEQGGIVQESYYDHYDHYANVQEFLASRPPPVGTQRERNRTAATKCRAKTKVVEARLEATERTMWEENTQLTAQVVGLREEVLALKTELLRHGYCDCELIQRYIRSEAMKIGGATTTATSIVPGNHSPGQQQYPPALQHLQAVMAEEESLGQGPGRPQIFRNDRNASSSMTPVTMATMTSTTPSAGSGHYAQQKHTQN